MASREKRPLAPSKSKQKASNDSGLPSNEVRNKKGKSLPSVKQQQLAQEIFDTVATGSQLPVKLEVSLPRRNALKNLKRKQNLRAAKANLKSKVTRKETNKNIHRIVKRGVRAKKIKQSEESAVKAVDTSSRLSENQTNNEGKGTETPSKSAKNNLRTKKNKSDIQNKEEASATSNVKVSPKLGRKGKTTESPDSLSKGAKTAKLTNLKKNNTKDNLIKVAEDNRDLHKGTAKSRKSGSGKESDSVSIKSNSSVEKFPKAVLDDKNSIDLTIDEVIASSMLSDTETENQQGVVTEKTEGKVTRSKKMLVDENIVCDIEIKKEPDTDDMKITSDGEYAEDQGFQNAIQLRKRSKVGYVDVHMSQRSLRNGKQRQLSDSGNSPDNDSKKRHRLNSDGTVISDNSMEHISDCNTNMDSCFSDHSCNESQTAVASSKEEMCLKDEVSKSFDEEADIGSEVENNNNSDRVDRTGETGPMLRSKTKAKTIENEATKDDDIKQEDTRITPKCEPQEDSKKLNNLDQTRKDSILAKFTDKSKGRRGSLNIDMKKTVNSFYSTDKSDGNSKSHIDQMIEDIKLNIAKTIESKIFGPEKGLGLSKNFDVPKIEEIVAPLSTESQKMGLEDSTDEDRLIVKNEITSDSSENSVPKVADTAKEIEEKLVKSDIGEAETNSQNIQENRASDSDRIHNVHNICESTCNISNNSSAAAYNSADEPEVENVGCSTAGDSESKTLQDDSKKIATRKSSRISDKTSDSVEARKSTSRASSKATSRLENPSDPSDDDATASFPLQAEERLTEKLTEAKGSEISCSSNSEDSETLESISREVERLVAEDDAAKLSLPSDANATSLSREIISDADKESAEIQRVNKQEASDDSSMTLESATDAASSETLSMDRSADAIETRREEKDDTYCNSAQSAKHSKTNNITTTANCDSNSDSSSSVNSVPACIPIESKELDRTSSGDPTSNSDESAISEQNPELNEITDPSNNKSSDNKGSEEQKPGNKKNRRVLRARDKQKRGQTGSSRAREYDVKVKQEEDGSVHRKTPNSDLQNDVNETPQGSSIVDATQVSEGSQKTEDLDNSPNGNELSDESSSQSRTRRSRDMKRTRKEELLSNSSKTKRVKRDTRKSDQQTKEETLLDNEVAKINENNRSFLNKYAGDVARTGDSFREAFFEQRELDDELDTKKGPSKGVRSKSENDIMIHDAKGSKSGEKRKLSRNLSENHVSSKQTSNNGIQDILENECKSPKHAPKDSDETSTSGESSNGDNMGKILETPEDKERKESILRTLGLESLEEAAKRMQNQQKIRKEQSSGTLKTIIKVSQKEKDKDKRGSGPPLKMIVLKQGRGDGEGDSPEIYTIQKEVRE